jgi:tetratricopeptide (TPR) repeat protein
VKRAEAHFHTDNAEAAKADLAKALELQPASAEAYKLMGRMSEAEENPSEAIASYKKAVELDPFVEGAREALDRLGAEQTTLHTAIGEPVKGWEIINPVSNRYVATNPEYPEMKVLLEMHGDGQPRILDWTPLSEHLQGFGLLRYAAGRLPNALSDEQVHEFVAIIDLRKNHVVSIEPYLIDGTEAKWAWSQTGVVVTDAEGVISAHELRAAPKPKPEAAPRDDRPWYDDEPWYEDEPRRYRRRPKGLFDWLFN